SDSHPGPQATHFHAAMAADFWEQTWPEVLGRRDPAQRHALIVNDWLPSEMQVSKRGDELFELDYPPTTDHMPRLPLDVPTALLAISYPLPIKEIRLAGKGLQSARVWVSTLDPNGHHDENQWHDLGEFEGPHCDIPLPVELAGRDLAEIRFHADVRRELP